MKTCITALAIVALMMAPAAQALPTTANASPGFSWSTLVATLLHWLDVPGLQPDSRMPGLPNHPPRIQNGEPSRPVAGRPTAPAKMPMSVEPGG